MEGEEEERRRGLVRRFMVGCKVAEYVAILLRSRLRVEDKERTG